MSEKKPFAAFTIVRNEPFFLRLWCEYYGRAFGDENLFILDNDSSDDSVVREKQRRPRLNVKRVSSKAAFDWSWTTHVIESFQEAALKAYDVVAYADADEFLLPSEHYRDLRHFCEDFRRSQFPYVRARGWAIIHQIDREAMLAPDCTCPLADRSSMWYAPPYDKTLLSKVPLSWSRGMHTIRNGTEKLSNDPVSPHLSLLHLRDVDMGVLHRRSVDRRKMPALNGNPTLTHGSTDVIQLQAWFRTRVAPWAPLGREFEGEVQPIPTHWRKLMSLTP